MMDTMREPDAFADLVYADEQWVRAEFDALMRECWPENPPGRPPHPPAPRPRAAAGPHGTARVPTGARAPAAAPGGSERAPPPG